MQVREAQPKADKKQTQKVGIIAWVSSIINK